MWSQLFVRIGVRFSRKRCEAIVSLLLRIIIIIIVFAIGSITVGTVGRVCVPSAQVRGHPCPTLEWRNRPGSVMSVSRKWRRGKQL